jgi:hypothetical protein
MTGCRHQRQQCAGEHPSAAHDAQAAGRHLPSGLIAKSSRRRPSLQHAVETFAFLSSVGVKAMIALAGSYRFAPALGEEYGVDNQ